MTSPNTSLNVAGRNVKRKRLSHRPPMTQEQLAVKLQFLGWNIDRFGISKIERGERQITDKELVLLATALSASVGSLVEDE